MRCAHGWQHPTFFLLFALVTKSSQNRPATTRILSPPPLLTSSLIIWPPPSSPCRDPCILTLPSPLRRHPHNRADIRACRRTGHLRTTLAISPPRSPPSRHTYVKLSIPPDHQQLHFRKYTYLHALHTWSTSVGVEELGGPAGRLGRPSLFSTQHNCTHPYADTLSLRLRRAPSTLFPLPLHPCSSLTETLTPDPHPWRPSLLPALGRRGAGLLCGGLPLAVPQPLPWLRCLSPAVRPGMGHP